MDYSNSIRLLRRGAIGAATCWSVVILAAIYWFSGQAWQQVMQIGIDMGKATTQKDIMYRDWNAAKGGVYVLIDQDVEPNPYLAHISDRDILTQSNQKLTLVNPAYMTKLVQQMGPEKYSLRAHLTSNNPLNDSNITDAWESNALKQLKEVGDVITELVTIEDKPYMRIITPLWVDRPCLKCHEQQGYKLGDLRGGISVAVPMKDLIAEARIKIAEQVIWGLSVVIAGLIGIFFFYCQLKGQLLKYSLSEKKADKLQEQWDSTFDEINDIISIQNCNYEIQRMNRSGYELLNLKLDDVIGQHCYKLFFNASRPCSGCFASVDNFDNFFSYLNEVQMGNGQTYLISVAPVRTEDGSVSGNVHMAKDITKTRELENKLQQSQKMEAIGTLAGGIAHDFNNILTAILGYSQMIDDELSGTSQAKENIQQVVRAGERAKGLVSQILTFSRQYNREEVKPMLVQSIAQEVVELLRPSIPKSITVQQNVNSQCRPIMAESSKIHQVIMNLCTNSCQAMGEGGGKLTISLNEINIPPGTRIQGLSLEPGEYLQLEVQDTGHGITSEIVGKIFDPYFTTKEKGEGTGLGLATVHGIVESMGGQIRVDSALGKGATFSVFFPVLKAETTDGEKDVEEPIAGGNERILVIDDHEEIVDLLQQMLGSLGYKVTTRSCSLEACELFTARPDDFDIVITDFDMPNMTGMGVARKVQKINPKVPIILCTGFGDSINVEKARSIGIQEYVKKPIIKREIAQKIRKVLGERQVK